MSFPSAAKMAAVHIMPVRSLVMKFKPCVLDERMFVVRASIKNDPGAPKGKDRLLMRWPRRGADWC